jgi:hypothetical protein
MLKEGKFLNIEIAEWRGKKRREDGRHTWPILYSASLVRLPYPMLVATARAKSTVKHKLPTRLRVVE